MPTKTRKGPSGQVSGDGPQIKKVTIGITSYRVGEGDGYGRSHALLKCTIKKGSTMTHERLALTLNRIEQTINDQLFDVRLHIGTEGHQ